MSINGNTEGPSGAQVSFWRGHGPQPVEFLKGRYRNFAYAPHSHDRYMVGLITQGAVRVVDPKGSAVVSCGQVALYTFDELHWGHTACERGWTILAAYLPPQTLIEIARDAGASFRGTIGLSGIAATNPGLARKIADLFRRCEIEHESLARSSLLLDIVVELLDRHSDSQLSLPDAPAERRAVQTARGFLDCNFSQNVSLGRLASECGISRYWLIKAFKSEWGIPPYAYLTNVRVRRAASLLREGRQPADVAHECGFADQSHLTRTFKRSLGLTPGLFKAQ